MLASDGELPSKLQLQRTVMRQCMRAAVELRRWVFRNTRRQEDRGISLLRPNKKTTAAG
jgi:hypothetical protein